ncbi:asparaginase [Lacicoccus alkaliphilus]|uniref:L-asparaginase n=1 Tax=Lacicoccus alkaliphilus DSM 16010 TaxID=1123231 RepID=A0A1M7BCY8_9BACL|nr:asparaginase [Salinicoccus alkaliphilus]SHL52479.1 L-asparaginase [Salinicoccus alkaliphilus DSM 16010]
MKRILAIHTGGTISMSETDGVVSQGVENPLNIGSHMIDDVGVVEIYPIKKPSPHITVDDMKELRKFIQDKERDYDGFVITHGTDTLEETAYFLDIALDVRPPVVITGAMRSSNEIGSDGMYNYLSSIRVAAERESENRGVLVVFNDEIHTSHSVTKTHTSNIATFQSPNHGPVGFLTKEKVYYHHSVKPRMKFDEVDAEMKVGLIKAHVGLDETFFDALIKAEYDGLIIEAMGQGNMPPGVMPALERVLEAGIVTVLVSRSFNGIVGGYYDYRGGGYELKSMGIIFSNGLNGQKARLKLLLALSNLERHLIKDVFEH